MPNSLETNECTAGIDSEGTSSSSNLVQTAAANVALTETESEAEFGHFGDIFKEVDQEKKKME